MVDHAFPTAMKTWQILIDDQPRVLNKIILQLPVFVISNQAKPSGVDLESAAPRVSPTKMVMKILRFEFWV